MNSLERTGKVELAQHPQRLREEGFRCRELGYRAHTWRKPRRVVLVLVPCETEELPIAGHFFLITDRRPQTMRGREVVAFYRQRGLFERMLGELSSTLEPKLPGPPVASSTTGVERPVSAPRPRDAFAANQAILTLNLWANNLFHLRRQAVECAEARRGRPRQYGRSTTRSFGPLSPGLPAPAVPGHLARAQGRSHSGARDGGRLVSSLEIPGHVQTGRHGSGVTRGRVGRGIGSEATASRRDAYNFTRSVNARGGLYPKKRQL